jgi:hypothetical protein
MSTDNSRETRVCFRRLLSGLTARRAVFYRVYRGLILLAKWN